MYFIGYSVGEPLGNKYRWQSSAKMAAQIQANQSRQDVFVWEPYQPTIYRVVDVKKPR